MLNFGASKPRVRGGARAPGGPPLDPHLPGHYHSFLYTLKLCRLVPKISLVSN